MIKKFIVHPRVPDRLRPLLEIARNLWWTWSRNATSLFSRIAPEVWESSGHNPLALLGNLHPDHLAALSQDEAFLAHLDAVYQELNDYLANHTWFSRTYGGSVDLQIAYFSMEFGLHESLPFYSGGLGVLAGDHLKSADELGLPFTGISLCYQEGYYRQHLNLDGWQQEHYPDNDLYNMPLAPVLDAGGSAVTVSIEFPGRMVHARLWKVQIGRVPLYLLDTNLPENQPHDRSITARLYGGDHDMRIRQEVLLGIGGVRALCKLGLRPNVYHMNEGHSAFLALERLRNLITEEGLSFEEALEASAAGNAFTTHTPVPAGNERFPPDMIRHYFRDYIKDLKVTMDEFLALGREDPRDQREDFCMTVLALHLSSRANAVSRIHGRTSRRMWRRIWPGVPEAEIPIIHITNGIHTQSWVADDFARLYERYAGPKLLREPVNPESWKRVGEIPESELWRTKERMRERLVSFVRARLRRQSRRLGLSQRKLTAAEEVLDPEVLTIGFARRFATYKRATLILRDLPRLRRLILNRDRPVQFIFAGKAHPHDHPAKELIRQVAQHTRDEELHLRVVFLEDYDLDIARHLVQGVDVWLNTPQRPLEASGTSGMKVPINGGLNISILDGWWCEGYQGDNGWAIGAGEEYTDREVMDQIESTILYDLLEQEIAPLFYKRGPDGVPREWVQIMKRSISSICPVFNTNRMVQDYTEKVYMPVGVQFSILSKNRYESARLLAAWKKHMRKNWHEVAIISVESGAAEGLEIGGALPITVRAHLGQLPPSEVLVEAVFGRLDTSGEILAGDSLALTFQSADGATATFTGSIPCRGAGRYGFAARVLPHRRELVHKFEVGKITWWTGDEALPSESVPEKVLGAGV